MQPRTQRLTCCLLVIGRDFSSLAARSLDDGFAVLGRAQRTHKQRAARDSSCTDPRSRRSTAHDSSSSDAQHGCLQSTRGMGPHAAELAGCSGFDFRPRRDPIGPAA